MVKKYKKMIWDMDSDSRYISKEFNSFQVISALDILQQFHKSDNRDYSVPLSNTLSLSARLFVRHPCTVVTLPMSDLEPFCFRRHERKDAEVTRGIPESVFWLKAEFSSHATDITHVSAVPPPPPLLRRRRALHASR